MSADGILIPNLHKALLVACKRLTRYSTTNEIDLMVKTLLELQEELNEFTDIQFKNLKTKTEEQVVEWFWATFSLFDLDPFYFEFSKIKPGKKLTNVPKSILNKWQYGLNAKDK